MKVKRHTPGPWHRNIPPASKYSTIFSGHRGIATHVAHVATKGLSEEEIEANANLIIAAPDLLAACKAVIKLQTSKTPQAKPYKTWSMVLDAIAKATGLLEDGKWPKEDVRDGRVETRR